MLQAPAGKVTGVAKTDSDFMHYNFVRIHKTLRVTPAMSAGVTERLWKMPDIVDLIEARETNRDRKRGPYKKRNSN